MLGNRKYSAASGDVKKGETGFMAKIVLRAIAYLLLLSPQRQEQALTFLERAFRDQEKKS